VLLDLESCVSLGNATLVSWRARMLEIVVTFR
jgi:hypothetical protein